MESIIQPVATKSEGLIRALQFAVSVPDVKSTIPAVQDVATNKSKCPGWVWAVGIGLVAIVGLYLLMKGKEAIPTREVKKSQDNLPVQEPKLDTERNQVDNNQKKGGDRAGDSFV